MTETRSTAAPGYQVVIPQLGLTMKEASILEWLQPNGTWVEKGQPLFTLENEKSIVEVEAPASGRLAIQVESGIPVPVLHPVAVLEGADSVPAYHAVTAEDLPAPISKETQSKEISRQTAKPGQIGKVAASPRARIAAQTNGLDLRQIAGSGIRGMVTLRDVEQMAIQSAQAASISPLARKIAEEAQVNLTGVQGSGPRGRIMRGDVENVLRSSAAQDPGLLSGLSGLRAIIAERLSQSWRERPHVTLTTEVDVSGLVAFRDNINALLAESQRDEGETVKISFNTLLIKLVAECLNLFPNINISLTRDGILEHEAINIGIAVDTERGLMVPVIKNARHLTLVETQALLQTLAKSAQEGRSSLKDLEGGTFTITNLGAYGIDAFTPIINPPESAILGVGRILPRPVGVDGNVVLRETVVLSLTFDHRLIDGAPAARFLQKLSELLAKPQQALSLDSYEKRTR